MSTPVVPPTIDEFLVRFPEFAESDEYMVEAMLLEASYSVDDTWVGVDQVPAVMYLAAHMIASGAEQEAGGSISSVSIGAISISYREPFYKSQQHADELARTEYGTRFLKLLKRNQGGPLVV